MAMATNAKGTVTALSSLYRAEESRKAALMVDQKIAENQNELQILNLFLSENANLIKLVQKLPDDLSHTVMVPFGKAAFFPGRLIHTNEFLVLLGEGYYAERTSKQTVEILGRRGKGLESQIESLKALMEDLKAEASFFLNTADEAAEGVVEIREDYIEEIPSGRFSDQAAVSKVDVVSTSKDAGIRGDDEDEEYARMMAKLDELEREELAAENVEGAEEQHFDQSLKIQEVTAVSKVDMVSTSKDAGIRGGDEEYARMMAKLDELEREELAAENIEGNEEQHFYQSLKIQELEDSHIMHMVKEKPLRGNVALDVAKCKIVEKSTHHPEHKAKGSAAMPNTSRAEFKKDIIGSIVEHGAPITETGPTFQSAAPSQPTSSKPVSRFKIQRAGR